MPITATAQSILDAANTELGLPLSTFGVTSYDQTGRQAIAMMQAIGDDLVRVHDWQFLEKTQTFTGDGSTSAFPLPADYGRIVNQTEWSTSNQRPMTGPMSPQMWGWCQYGIVSSGFYYRYRILENKLHVFPTPGAGEEFAFFYVSKNWVMDASMTYKDTITFGTDVPLFDKRLMTSGVKARLWGQKGFDTTQVQAEFDYVLSSEKGITQAAPVIGLSGNDTGLLIGPNNVPDGNWKVT